MVPSLYPSDVLHVERCSLSQISPGEIALCKHEGRFFAHRAVEKFSAGIRPQLRTRGDALDACDPARSESEVLGRVILVERGERRFAPPRLGAVRSLLAALVRRSDWAGRAILAAHGRLGIVVRQALAEIR
jgi:hypothetical protein